MKVLVIGPNNSGKGTLVNLLKEKTNFKAICCSDVLKDYGMDTATGKLLPDSCVVRIMRNHLIDEEENNLILDGFPRTLEQDKFMNDALFEPDLVIVLNISEEEVLSRAVGRRLCEKCGDSYNLNGFKLPEVDNICDKCGGKLYQRKDDSEEVVKARYNEYIKETFPIVTRYKYNPGKTVVWEFDTSQSTKEIAETVSNYINYKLD